MDEHENMETVIRNMDAVHKIYNLEADYCFAADSYNGDLYATVFTEDGILDMGSPIGMVQGRDALKAFCRDQFPKGFSFGMHFLHNPKIIVTGNTAKGKMYWEASLTDAVTNTATRAAGIYHTEYLQTNEGWKIKRKKVDMIYNTSFCKGWVEEKFYGQK